MKNECKKMKEDIKEYIFEQLKELDYWGEFNLLEILDFCTRNRLDNHKKALTNLLK